MLKIARTPAAVRDLAAITDYIAADTLSAPLAFYDEIDGLLTVLAQYPDMGEVVDNLSPGLRRFTPGISCVLLSCRRPTRTDPRAARCP